MQTDFSHEPRTPTHDDGACLMELKKAYNAGLLVTTVTADMINERILTAVFEDAQPANNLVH